MVHTAKAERDSEYAHQPTTSTSDVEDEIARSFGPLIVRCLRRRVGSLDLIEDIRQETLLRVIIGIREQKVRRPERLGAYVMGICNNVRKEFARHNYKYVLKSQDTYAYVPDATPAPDAVLASKERKASVESALARLPAHERRVLAMAFLDEDCSRKGACGELGVTEAYFRVMVHRAKSHFRQRFKTPVE